MKLDEEKKRFLQTYKSEAKLPNENFIQTKKKIDFEKVWKQNRH